MVDRQVRRWWWSIAVLEVVAIALQLYTWGHFGVFFRGFTHGVIALALIHTWFRWHSVWHRPPLGPPPQIDDPEIKP